MKIQFVRPNIVLVVLLFATTLLQAAVQPKPGDHFDFTLLDGRAFKNANVLKNDGTWFVVVCDRSITAFKASEVRTYEPTEKNTHPTTPAEDVTPNEDPVTAPVVTTESDPASAPSKAKTAAAPFAVTPQQFPSSPISRAPVSGANAYVGLSAALLLAVGVAYWQMKAKRQLALEAKKTEEKLTEYMTRYSAVIDIDRAVSERQMKLADIDTDVQRGEEEKAMLAADLTALRQTLSLYNSEQDMVACGHYRPAYSFDTSEEYKESIDDVREKQREMLKNGTAAVCPNDWLVNGSASEGKKATKRTLRLMLRAYNGESDAIIANVSWSNIDRMMDRLSATFTAINKLGESYGCSLTTPYRSLKEQELRLAFEYANKRQKEKDEQRELRERMRDEERARREMEEALRQTAADEERAKVALEKARAEVGKVSGEKEEALNTKIRQLEGRLAEALANKERALSRAQQTRSGHVYIISNIGSFGDAVFKIGMTRRLDPYDRVHELSDASVPFAFDVHGMIYTDDAPAMETKLHQRFDQKRVNLVNERKEFFFATMDEIEVAVKEMGATITLSKLAEAREYRETMARKKALSPSVDFAGIPNALYGISPSA